MPAGASAARRSAARTAASRQGRRGAAHACCATLRAHPQTPRGAHPSGAKVLGHLIRMKHVVANLLPPLCSSSWGGWRGWEEASARGGRRTGRALTPHLHWLANVHTPGHTDLQPLLMPVLTITATCKCRHRGGGGAAAAAQPPRPKLAVPIPVPAAPAAPAAPALACLDQVPSDLRNLRKLLLLRHHQQLCLQHLQRLGLVQGLAHGGGRKEGCESHSCCTHGKHGVPTTAAAAASAARAAAAAGRGHAASGLLSNANLGALDLALHGDARGYVPYAHSSLHFVHVLAACSGAVGWEESCPAVCGRQARSRARLRLSSQAFAGGGITCQSQLGHTFSTHLPRPTAWS